MISKVDQGGNSLDTCHINSLAQGKRFDQKVIKIQPSTDKDGNFLHLGQHKFLLTKGVQKEWTGILTNLEVSWVHVFDDSKESPSH